MWAVVVGWSVVSLLQRGNRGAFSQTPRFAPVKPSRPATAGAFGRAAGGQAHAGRTPHGVAAQPSIHLTAGLAEAVAASGRRYAIMRSTTPRFRRHSAAAAAESAHLGLGTSTPT